MFGLTRNSRESNHNSRVLRYFLLAASIMTLLLIILGILVRIKGAAQGCPDWPTCYGSWGIPASLAARLQYTHRALAILAGLIILISIGIAYTQRHRQGWVRFPLIGAGVCVLLETLIGANSITQGSHPASANLQNPVHLGFALLTLALVVGSTVAEFLRNPDTGKPIVFSLRTPFGRWALAGSIAIFFVMVSGVFLTAQNTALVCTSWPFCSRSVLPTSPTGWVEITHRLVTGFASGVVIGLMIAAWRRHRSQQLILTAATATTMLFISQVLVGALKTVRGYPLDLAGLHATTTALLWASLVTLVAATGFSGRSEADETIEASQPIYWRERLKDLLILTKPIIVALLLVTTYAGMVMGGRRFPSLELTFWTLLGGAMAAGGASAINQYIDRELDQRMQRTARRPLAAKRLTPAEGLAFGLALCILSFFLISGFVNLLAGLLSLAGMVYYVLLYSIFLKKATVQNIVIGGGAGAIPPLVGWAAATGSLAVPSLFLFAIVFLWTPPHFWALALIRRKDYARAGVPMLPVVKGEQSTRLQIFIYTLQLVGLTLLMPVLKMAGSLFLVSAVVLGAAFIAYAWWLLRRGGNKAAYKLYRYSSMYLALIFVALVVDVFI